MATTIVDVEEVLHQRDRALTLCPWHAPNSAREPYRTTLLQSQGFIEANEARVGHEDAVWRKKTLLLVTNPHTAVIHFWDD